MQDLLIATTNRAKIEEYRLLLRDFPLQLLSLRDLNITDQAPEDADTFRANARIKAHFYFERSGIATLADDGGLEVDALAGAPGVRSHRWLGVPNPDDRALADAVIDRMTHVPTARRTARLRAAVALVSRASYAIRENLVEATFEGVIADHCYPEVRAGFPYRSVLYLPERGCYLAELSDEEAARISQRRQLVQKLAPELESLAKSA